MDESEPEFAEDGDDQDESEWQRPLPECYFNDKQNVSHLVTETDCEATAGKKHVLLLSMNTQAVL
jgi:hypothetical protein